MCTAARYAHFAHLVRVAATQMPPMNRRILRSEELTLESTGAEFSYHMRGAVWGETETRAVTDRHLVFRHARTVAALFSC